MTDGQVNIRQQPLEVHLHPYFCSELRKT